MFLWNCCHHCWTVFWLFSWCFILCAGIRSISNSTLSPADKDLNERLQQLDLSSLGLANLPEKPLRYGPLGMGSGQYMHDKMWMTDVNIKSEARTLSSLLRKISNEEILVTSMQEIFDKLPYGKVYPDQAEKIYALSSRVRKKFSKYLDVLERNKAAIEDIYRIHLIKPITEPRPCCVIGNRELSYDENFGTRINKSSTCDVVPPIASTFNPGRRLTDVFSRRTNEVPILKWQYFISVDGIHNEYPAHNVDGITWRNCNSHLDIRHRDIYLATLQPRTKYVTIVIDHGMGLSAAQIVTAKAIGKHILSSLSHRDKVGLIGLSYQTSFPRNDDCLSNKLAYATHETKTRFTQFIDGLEKEKGATNHSLAFMTAFDMIGVTLNEEESSGNHVDEALIIYVSRGLLSSIANAKVVMETIAEYNDALENRVIINTYALIDETKVIINEKSFLQDIADQNFDKYEIKQQTSKPRRHGNMVPVSSPVNLSFTVGKFYTVLNSTSASQPCFSLPYWDDIGRGLVLSISQTCVVDNTVVGVVGIDLHVADIVEDITYYNEAQTSYAFQIDNQGYTIMHPSFTRPLFTREQPMHTDILHVENKPGFTHIRERLLNEDIGQAELELKISDGNSTTTHELPIYEYHYQKYHRYTAVYMWRRIPRTPFTVCIVTMDTNQQSRDLKNVATRKDLVYHRLDIDVHPRENLCMHLKQLSTLDAPTVFLAAGAFEVPFEYITREETKLRIQGYTAYLNDNTMLIANPGLKKSVRNSAAALSRIGVEWKQKFKMSKMSPYVVRRYIAAPPGVFVVYPGTVVSKTFDPTKRPWFTKALEYPGRVVITAPYLDIGGAGYIVTISHTIFEGKAAAMHSATDQVVAVMGIDFPVGYLHKLLIDVVPFCSEPHFRCFIFDDTGYIVAHLNMIEPPLQGPIEKLHITHKEPLVANDILEHEHFVYKKLCNSFSDRTIQRFYQFNTTLSNMLTNEINRELCSRYKIVAVPGTNVFLGVVNQTCNVNTAFCPCSRVDRLCLNCLRMEQNECECPCECPLDMDFCSGELLDTEDRNPSCSHYNEYPQAVHIDPSITKFLPRCTNNFCSGWTRQSDCVGMVDCEWCQFDADGETVLDTPFCETQRVCFGGVLGANSPYNDHVHAQARHGPPLSVRHTPVGPVAGGIMGCFLVLALAVYCYRHHVHRTAHQYICTVNDTAVHMSQLDNEIDEGDLPSEEPAAGHTNIVLSSFENPASISPYRVNTTYRRPPGGDSDHGYSTMTPHEDSEHCTPYIEPLVIGKFPRAMGSPTTSDICSMTSRSDIGGTCSDASGPSTRSELFKLPAPVSVSRSKRLQQLPTITQLPEHTVLPSSPLLAKETNTTPGGTTMMDSGTHVLVDVQVHAVDTH